MQGLLQVLTPEKTVHWKTSEAPLDVVAQQLYGALDVLHRRFSAGEQYSLFNIEPNSILQSLASYVTELSFSEIDSGDTPHLALNFRNRPPTITARQKYLSRSDVSPEHLGELVRYGFSIDIVPDPFYQPHLDAPIQKKQTRH